MINFLTSMILNSLRYAYAFGKFTIKFITVLHIIIIIMLYHFKTTEM